MLCEQNIRNVWRKNGFGALVSHNKKVQQLLSLQSNVIACQIGTPEADQWLNGCVEVFRERIDFTVVNTVPVKVPFATKLEEMVKLNGQLLTGWPGTRLQSLTTAQGKATWRQ